MAAKYSTPIGFKFNRLTILSDAPKKASNNNARVFASCECGTIKDYVRSEVMHGGTKSCGCIRLEISNSETHGHTKGKSFSPEYYSWTSMITRCTNEKSRYFSCYGGRGILICDRWMKFENFLADMGKRPDGMTLDRFPDCNGNYEPSNCRWASKKDQANNTRRNSFFEYLGITKTIAQWSDEFGLTRNTLIARLYRLKWPIERALLTKPKPSYKR